VLLTATYLAVVNGYLRSRRLQQTLSRDPNHFSLQYASAWSVLPGIVHLRQLELHGQSRTVQWWVKIDSATIAIDLPLLVNRELATTSMLASGVAFRLRRRPEVSAGSGGAASAASTARTAATVAPGSAEPPAAPDEGPPSQIPPIPGLVNTLAPPETPEQADAGPQWRIRLAGVNLEHLDEVWVGDYRFAGDVNAAGGFDLHIDHSFALDPATAAIRAGTLQVASRQALAAIAGTAGFELPEIDPNRLQGGFLRLASGSLRLHGRMEGLHFLQPYLKKVPWIELGGSAGTFDAHLRVRQGTYLPGTHIEARPDSVTARLLDDEATGRCTLSWDVAATDGGAAAVGKLVAAFDEFRLGHAAGGPARAHGRGLRVEIATRDLRVAALPAPTALTIDLPPTEVGNFSSYNVNLPHGAGIAMRSGTGVVSASLRAAAPTWEATGSIDLRGNDVVVDAQGARLRGNLKAHSRFRALPRQRQLFLTESAVEVADVVRLNPPAGTPPLPGWWARLRLDYLTVKPRSLIVMQARLQSTLSDTRPLFALFAPQRRPLLSWLDRLLDLHPIDAVGELAVGDGYFAIDKLTVTSGKANIEARLRFAGGQSNGILYAAYGPLSAGLELRNGQRSFKLIRARRWFDSYPRR
jgi:hypothetical protein